MLDFQPFMAFRFIRIYPNVFLYLESFLLAEPVPLLIGILEPEFITEYFPEFLFNHILVQIQNATDRDGLTPVI